MTQPIVSLRDRAEFYSRRLPQTTRYYLNRRGIPDTLIERYTLGWNGKAITIPIEDRHGEIAFTKHAKHPLDGSLPPTMQMRAGGAVELFGWRSLKRKPGRIVIAGNELDCLVLEARGFPAIASTAGMGTFQLEWAKHLNGIHHIYVCFGVGAASDAAAERIGALIPRTKTVRLPESVGPGGGVTEFFVGLGKTRKDFEKLLSGAVPVPSVEALETPLPISRSLKHAERLKAEVPIARVIGGYTTLRHDGDHLVGRCPLHEEAKPTLHVYPATNTFHCFGCGAGGDAITFLEKKNNLTFGQAIDALEKIRYGDDFPHAA